MSIAINLPDGMIARIGLDPDILKVALAAWIITGLTVHRRLALIALTLGLCFAANMPEPMARQLGVDRDYFLATLIALVVTGALLRERM